MKAFCVTITALINVATAGCGNAGRVAEPVSQVANDAEMRETKTVAAPKDLTDVLRKVRNVKSDSYHRFLRKISLLVPPRCVGQQWNTVTKIMEQHRFPVVESWDNGDAAHCYYLVKKKAFQFSNGHSLDLHILLTVLLSAENADRPNLPARPGKIYAADTALVADINAPYADLVAQERYPKGSILDTVLRLDKVKAVGSTWPLLKKVYVHYGYLFDRWVEHSPSGFHVTVEFSASINEKVGGKKMYFFVPSGLDPLRSPNSQEELLDGFTAKDTLGGIRSGGGNEWWYGAPDVVEANQKKYLKNRK